jgi:hypothetical protein
MLRHLFDRTIHDFIAKRIVLAMADDFRRFANSDRGSSGLSQVHRLAREETASNAP